MLKATNVVVRGRRSILTVVLVVVFLMLGAVSAYGSAPESRAVGSSLGLGSGLIKTQDFNTLAASDDYPGVPLPPFSPFGGYVNKSYPEYCVFQFHLEQNQSFSVDLSVPFTGDFDVFIADEQGLILDSSTYIGNGVSEYMSGSPAAAGTFYFVVQAFSGYGNYTATYSIGSPGSYSSGPVHRFYKFSQGVHFYTNNQSEATYINDNLGATYRYEGTRFQVFPVLASGMTPVYRFYNFLNGVHFYTTNWYEAMEVINNAAWTFRYEGIAFYAHTFNYTPGATPVHRFYNFRQGSHFYTNSDAEKTQLETSGAWTYRYETIAFW